MSRKFYTIPEVSKGKFNKVSHNSIFSVLLIKNYIIKKQNFTTPACFFYGMRNCPRSAYPAIASEALASPFQIDFLLIHCNIVTVQLVAYIYVRGEIYINLNLTSNLYVNCK